MPIPFACPYCGATGSARDDGAGRVVRCPKCQKRIQLPAISSEPPPPRSPVTVQPVPVPASSPGYQVLSDGPRREREDSDQADRGEERDERPSHRRTEPDDFDDPPAAYSGVGVPRRVEVDHTMRFGQAVKMGWGLGIGFWLAWMTIVLIGFAIASLVMCVLSAGLFSAASSSTSSSSTGTVRPFGK